MMMSEKHFEDTTPAESKISDSSADLPLRIVNPEETFNSPPTESKVSSSVNGVRTVTGLKWCLVCVALYFCCIIYGLDTTIAADVQAAVVGTFNDVGQLTWMGTGFPLGSVCAILPFSALYARFDMKKLLIGSTTLFEVGSAICGAAPTMDALIVGRVIAGVGGSGMYIGTLNYFSMLTTTKERGGYMAVVGFFWGAGAILGPVVGGGFSIISATWRWSFYINLFCYIVCLPIFIFYLPALMPAETGLGVFVNLSAIDWTGMVLSTGTIVCFTMVLTFAGSTWEWNDGRTITLFVVFGVLLIALVIQQRYALLTTPDNRMSPPSRVFKSRSQITLNIETFFAAWATFVPLYYIPNYFQFVHGDSAIMAAVRLLPFVIILITSNIVAGMLLPRINYYAAMYLAAGICEVIGSALMFTVTLDSPAAHVYGYSILIAIGAGPIMNSGYAIGGIKMSTQGGSAQDVNSAVAVMNISQLGGILMALLISGQIFQSLSFEKLKTVLGNEGLTDVQIQSVAAGTRSVVFSSLSPELSRLAVQAITETISKIYILAIVAGATILLCSLTMRWERLFKPASVASSAPQ